MSKYHIGFIGTGGRSVHYARHYAARDDMEIVALADPLPHNRKVFCVVFFLLCCLQCLQQPF